MGFNQKHDLDYTKIFNLVIKPIIVRLVLCIIVSQNWPLHQLDENNVFSYGDLSKEVYMKQPSTFAHKNKPSFVCKLKKGYLWLKTGLSSLIHSSQQFSACIWIHLFFI